MTEQIGAIWSDFDVKDGVGGKYLSDGRADFRFGRQDQQPSRIFTDAQLFCAAKHPFASDAAQFALANPQSVGQFCAGQGERNLVAHLVIFCAADDLSGSTAAIINNADGETIGIWMLPRLLNLRDNDLIEICSP